MTLTTDDTDTFLFCFVLLFVYFLVFFLSFSCNCPLVCHIQAIEAAKSATGISNESQAIEAFKRTLNDSSNFFNAEAFPANESDEDAHENCNTIEKAKINCPQRWKVLESWFKEARMVS